MSRSENTLGIKEELVSDRGRPIVTHELGLHEAIQRTRFEPTEQVQEIDIDSLREQDSWRVEGEWFPYEIFADEFVFVIDDDKSVFVSTVNLPIELREKANDIVRQIAGFLYE